METKTAAEEIGLEYEEVDGYLLPKLELEPPRKDIGKYGRMRRKFLMEHRNPAYIGMLLEETLNDHLIEVDEQAGEMMEQLMSKMAAAEGVTEKLKAEDQMKWVGLMNSIRQSAEEIVLEELVYS